MNYEEPFSGLLQRIAAALDRLAPPQGQEPAFDACDAFVWQTDGDVFLPVDSVNRGPIKRLKGINSVLRGR